MKYIEIPDEVMRDLLESVEGVGADAMWSYIREDIPGISSKPYNDRKHYFLSVMYRLMKEGRLKIAYQDKFWEGTIEEQLERYSDRWPKDESRLDKADFQLIDVDGLLCYWAEGGFVWVYEDGFMEWT